VFVRVRGIGIHLEGHEVAQILLPRQLQAREQFGWRTRNFQIDVLGRSRAFKSQFEYQPAFE